MKTYLKKNKALFILPLALIPFVILIFYVLGGGTEAGKEETEQEKSQSVQGANYILPEAEKSIEIFDKLEAYQQQGITSSVIPNPEVGDSVQITGTVNQPEDSIKTPMQLLAEQNPQLPEDLLAHIKQKEKEAKRELYAEQKQKSSPASNMNKKTYKTYQPKPRKQEKTVQPEPVLQTTGIEELDKVFDENITLNRENDSLKFYLQQTKKQVAELEQKKNAGFTLEKSKNSAFEKGIETGFLIKAEIYETTTVLDGNRVKLRLLEDTQVNNQKIKKNTFIYGTCKIKNERLHIHITQLPTDNDFIPVNLTIHDLDGLLGLYVPDNAARTVTREVGSSTNTSSLFGVTNNPLTYAGIRAADRATQTLLKRVRLKKVTVKKNTLVSLINQK